MSLSFVGQAVRKGGMCNGEEKESAGTLSNGLKPVQSLLPFETGGVGCPAEARACHELEVKLRGRSR